MNTLKKFLSRKFLTAIGAGITIIVSSYDPDLKPIATKSIAALSAIYIVIEGIIDMINKKKND